MTIIMKDGGNEYITENVIAYDVLTEGDLSGVEEELHIKLTEEQRNRVIQCINKTDIFPCMEDLREIVKNVHEGRW